MTDYMWTLVYQYLLPTDVLNCSRACRSMRKGSDYKHVWAPHVLRVKKMCPSIAYLFQPDVNPRLIFQTTLFRIWFDEHDSLRKAIRADIRLLPRSRPSPRDLLDRYFYVLQGPKGLERLEEHRRAERNARKRAKKNE